jgi:hypothetical protein
MQWKPSLLFTKAFGPSVVSSNLEMFFYLLSRTYAAACSVRALSKIGVVKKRVLCLLSCRDEQHAQPTNNRQRTRSKQQPTTTSD